MIAADDLLFADVGLREHAGQPEMDPLREVDALVEAQVVDARFDAVNASLGLLFDLRTALQLRESNTGVLVVHDVTEFTWLGTSRAPGRIAHVVAHSEPQHENGEVTFLFRMWPPPGADLRIIGRAASFFAGNAKGLPETPPDYAGTDDSAIRRSIPQWGSHLVINHAVFLDPV